MTLMAAATQPLRQEEENDPGYMEPSKLKTLPAIAKQC